MDPGCSMWVSPAHHPEVLQRPVMEVGSLGRPWSWAGNPGRKDWPLPLVGLGPLDQVSCPFWASAVSLTYGRMKIVLDLARDESQVSSPDPFPHEVLLSWG